MAQINATMAIILDEHKAKVYISLRQKSYMYKKHLNKDNIEMNLHFSYF